jgi:NAD(P)-dependent dehydrogenase (short-subunit alcohol dehydrogenase family)
MRRFEGKVALVTGAASGIGRATAERLAEEGARVVCSDVQAEAVRATAKRVEELGSEALALVTDVSDPAAAERSVDETLARFEQLDVLCNIAGILKFSHTHEHSLEDWRRILDVNLTGTFLMCRAALPHLLARQGNIVNMASTAGLAGHPWTAAYSASKGGVLALTYTLAVEYGKQGLRANALCPGSVSTPITEQFALPEGADRKLVYRIMPLDKFRGPETVASAVAFLASADAAHINGVALRVDGATLS